MARFIIKNKVLENVFGLENIIEIPEGVNKIRKNAFAGCPNIQKVAVNENNSELILYEGVIYSGDMKKILFMPDACTCIRIPKELDSSAFDSIKFYGKIIIPTDWKYGGTVTRRMLRYASEVEYNGISVHITDDTYIGFIVDFLDIITSGRKITSEFLHGTARREVKDPIVLELCRHGDKAALDYLKENFLRYARASADKNSMEELAEYEKYGMYNRTNTTVLAEYAAERKNQDIIQYFLDLKDKKFGFTLDETDRFLKLFEENNELTAQILDYRNKYFSADLIDKNETEKMEKELGLKERTSADWRKIFSYTVDKGEVTIIGYKGDETDVNIPESICGKPVTAIGDMAFSPERHGTRNTVKENLMKLKSVYFGENIRKTGFDMFRGCEMFEEADMSQCSSEVYFSKPFHADKIIVKQRENTDIPSEEELKNIHNYDILKFAGIEWIVLEKNSSDIKIISRDIIFNLEYDKWRKCSGWENSDIRHWLNNTFYKYYFTEDEKKLILQSRVEESLGEKAVSSGKKYTYDYIYLAGKEDVLRFFTAEKSVILNESWWLRSRNRFQEQGVYVGKDGEICEGYYSSYVDNIKGIRPVMCISTGGYLNDR